MLNFLIKQYKTTRAFKRLFYDEKGSLKKEAEVVLAFLRDESNGKGSLGKKGLPFFYDAGNWFDDGSAAFCLGKRRMFDLIIKHLSLNETEIFNLISKEQKTQEEAEDEIKENLFI